MMLMLACLHVLSACLLTQSETAGLVKGGGDEGPSTGGGGAAPPVYKQPNAQVFQRVLVCVCQSVCSGQCGSRLQRVVGVSFP